jgi:iron complex outermembrane receptor protein
MISMRMSKQALGTVAGQPAGRAIQRLGWLAGVALCSLAVPGYAQDAQEPVAQNEEADTGYGESIVITAERRATNLQDTPLSVVAVTSEIAEAKGIEDLEDLSKFTPNLSITPSRGGGNNTNYFVIRGIGGGGGATGERGVGLYVDGIYMPRTSGAVLRVLDIDRVEVLRGPQGTLFGRNSTGGAIRIFSKQPTDEFEGYVRGTLGNMDRTDFVGMVNIPLTDSFAIRAQGAYLEQDGFVQRGTEMLGAERDIIGRIQAKFEPSSRLRATLGFVYNDSESNGTPYVMTEFDMRPGVEGVIQGNYADWINDAFKLAGQPPLAAYNDPRIVTGDPYRASDLCFMDDFHPDYDPACNQFSNDVFWQADFNISYDLTDNLTVSSITGYSKLEHEGNTDFQVLGTENRSENVNSKVFYQELQLNAALFGGAVDLVTGGSYFHEDSTAPNVNITRKGTSVFPSAAQQNAAGFNQARWGNGNGDGGLFRAADTITSQISDSYGVFASATWHVNEFLNLTGGVRQAWDKKDYTQTRFPGTPNIGSIGNAPVFTVTPEFTVAPGTTSTTVHADGSFKALDYRGTVDVHITDDIMAYATISKAYKAGSFSHTIVGWTAANQATGEAQSALIVPIPNENVVNYEIGTRMELFNGRLRLNPTAFYMDYTNRQAAVQVQCATIGIPASQCPVGFVIQVSNQGNVRLQGVEVDGQLSITRNFVLDGSFAFTKAELRNAPAGTVNLFPDVPSPTFNAGATWSLFPSFGEVTLNANYAYVGKQATHPSEGTDSSYTLPSYGLVNARIRVELNDLPISITAFANNLLDNTYATYAQRFGGGFWDSPAPSRLANPMRSALAEVRGRPRELGLTLQYDF